MMYNDNPARELALDTSKSFIVQAPAGSGKTSLLTMRFLKLLLSVEQPEQVLALTFTKKAAGEMRERVINALVSGHSELAQLVLAHAANCKWHILQNPNRIKIQTFDSLCAFIVFKRPFLSGFGASMNVTQSASELYQQTVSNLLQRIKDLPDYAPAFAIVFNHFDNDRNRLAALLQELLPVRQQWLALISRLKNEDLTSYLNSNLEQVRVEFIAQANSCLLAIDSELLKPILKIAHGYGLLASNHLPLDLPQLLSLRELMLTKAGDLRKAITKAQGIELAEDKNELKRILNLLSDLKVDLAPLAMLDNIVPLAYSANQLIVLQALIKILLLLVAQFDVQTVEYNEVDFTQIAIAAGSALGHIDAPSELALELDYNLQHILVDEFQDTSIAQFHILQQLTNSWDDYSGKTIFFVGDPMQSIYKFRQANVSIFLDVKEHGFNNLSVDFLALNSNFRATTILVDWLNKICSQFFPSYDDYNLGAVSFAPSVATNPELQSSVQGFFTNDQAAQIITLIAQHPNQSIAILVRARTHLPQILQALNKQRLSYSGVDIGLLIDKPIVQNLVIVTKALLDFTDQISWLAVLRLPWIGLSLADIQIVATQATTALGAILTVDTLSSDGQMRLNLIKPIIEQAYFNKTNLTISSLVRQVFANLTNKIKISTAQMFEVTSYLKFLSQLEVEHITLTSQMIVERLEGLYINYAGHKNTLIQVMTIHKAKGLEFDTVIIPYLNKYPQNDQTQLILFDNQLIAHIRDASEQAEPIYRYLQLKKSLQNNFEARRLLYVALTRAKKNIYLLSEPISTAPKNSFLAFLGSFVNKFTLIEQGAADSAKVAASYQRLPLALINSSPLALVNTALNNELESVKYFDANFMRTTGIVLHEILHYIATIGIANTAMDSFDYYIQQRIANKIYQTLAMQTLAKVFHNSRARNILSHQHRESYSEWSIVTNFKEVKKNILDRAYLDDKHIFWIVDYKLCDNNELDAKINEFNKQLKRYIKCVVNLKKYKQVKGLIYLLMQDEFLAVN
jgi:ATP-dependent helicase/nuclease subunit A